MFQAPETDTDPTAGGFSAPDTDLDAPKWSDLPKNIIPDAMAVGKSGLDMGLRTAKGIADLPSDVENTVKGEYEHLFKGENPFKGVAESPLGQDISTVGGALANTAKAIPGQVKNLGSKSEWIQHPVQNAMTAGTIVAPFLGGEEAAAEGAAKSLRLPKPPAAIGEKLPIPKPEIPEVPAAPAALPVVAPGAKTGAPHALFAYNDEFGPGGAPRSIYNVFGDPEHPAIKQRGWGSSIPAEDLEKAGIPITGRQPNSTKWEPITPQVVPMAGKGTPGVPPSRLPPDPNAPLPKAETPPPAKEDPFKDVRDYIASKGAKIEQKGGWPEKVAKYLKNEANDLGAKDIGLQGRQIQSMGHGFEGVEKAEQLVSYAREKGYLDPGLSDVARKEKIIATTKQTGEHLDAIRNVADKRGTPPLDAIKQAVKQELEAKYGAGTEKATSEIANVMDDVNKAKPTFSGMSELATKLNRSATKVKDLGQHPGPTTDAANIVSRINNDAIRNVLNEQEKNLYTQSLRDYGAHKKLEQAVAGANRRSMTGRSNQRGPLGRLWQEALDRGGYRIAGNVSNRVADTILKNPGKIKTLPQFFEELGHQSDDALDEALGINGMAKGGMVPNDVKEWITSRGC